MSTKHISLSTVAGLFNLKGTYQLAFSFLFGMSVWISFFGGRVSSRLFATPLTVRRAGVIAYKTLPRPQFGALQHKTFPIYFLLSQALGGGVLAIYVFEHPAVLTQYASPRVPEVAQAYTLLFAILLQSTNYFIVGPMTSKTMFQRMRLEKDEGKSYTDAGISDAMKALNRRFGMLHGVSSLANLGAVFALAFHGLWIGNGL
ncbi:DUF4149 domain-containing protein [Mycena kentingensis (nom. inval.)]|nr:DUF4149 domain-containing protein [Mycena kentingensis (nom. inval.)]